MFRTIKCKDKYIKKCDVENLPISYEDKMSVNLFGNQIKVEKNAWMWHLHLKITNRCNAKCSFCVEQNSHCNENSKYYIGQVDKMLSEMEKARILFSVSITGGEPFLFPEFRALCEVLRRHNIKFLTMNTNASYLEENVAVVDGLFDFIDISRHSISDKENFDVFNCQYVPTISDLKRIKSKMIHTKMRIQCVMEKLNTTEKMKQFIDAFSFADDISFRRLMKLGDEYGVNYGNVQDNYDQVLDYAYHNFEFKEQTIQDYYVYEIWNSNGTDITFSYSNMKMLKEVEQKEDSSVTREFIIHPNGVVSGSWDYNRKVILS